VVTCHRAVSSVDVREAVSDRVKASTWIEPQAADKALQIPSWRECLGPVSETRGEQPLACRR